MPLGEVLTRSKEQVEIDPHQQYKQVTIRLWGQGVVLRDEVIGAKIAGAKRFVVRPQQFILSRIDARHGALGLVPDLLDGAVVSNDFPAFTPNPSRIRPAFIGWMSKTSGFVNLCRAASEGTTNRVRLKEDRFMATKIALPPLSEQQRIVARIEELAARIEEARGLRRTTLKETEVLLASMLHQSFVERADSWMQTEVGAVSEIIDPNPSHRMPQYAEEGIPFISTVDFYGSESIRKITAKRVAEMTYREQLERCCFAIDDILYSRIGTIGKARILREIWPFALSHVLVVIKPKEDIILPRFLLWYLRSDSIAIQATTATQSTGVPDLGIKRIREFTMPLPSLQEQQRIVAHLDNLQATVESVKQLQTETAAEIDALLPSVLDKAFKGAL